jgi:predicted site-specific integrase-resolvase
MLRTEAEAAQKLRCARKTLQNWRWAGKGPRFVKLDTGGIRYDDADLERFVAGRVYGSTTEAQAARRSTVGGEAA